MTEKDYLEEDKEDQNKFEKDIEEISLEMNF